VAARYDLLNRVLSLGQDRGWRRRAVAALAPVGGGRYLDVGCGTGDLCLDILRRVPSAHTVGVDASAAMLARARRKAETRGLGGAARFEQGDAQALAFPDAGFDGVISAFCIRNLTCRAAAFGEMKRVAKPGGAVVILELAAPGPGPRGAARRFYNRHVIPAVGRMLSEGTAYRYLADSIRAFADAGVVVNELRRAGFAEAAAAPLGAGLVTLYTATVPSEPQGGAS
jgi:demethylmenaquinone methyltransferase/2-methoxy-6-polyprenyl-1,4-benzoquinol methylase